MLKQVLPLTLISILPLLAGCGTKMVVVTPQKVLLTHPQKPVAVRAAIIRALRSQRYHSESEKPGQIVALHNRRGVRCRMLIEYTDREYTIRYMDSQGLRTDNTGLLRIEKRYARMTKRLSRAIDDEIARPAREAAEARERERRHQLALEDQRRRAAEEEQRRREQRYRPNVNVHVHPAPLGPRPAPARVYRRRHHHRSSTQSLTCTVNGVRYRCPTQQAFQNCSTLQPHTCTRF
jgi:hypothetical protein